MKYVIENFQKMTGGQSPGVNKSTQHRFIQTFIPPYFLLANEASDSTNFKQKVNPAYPLVLTPAPTTVRSKASKYPVLIIANETDQLDRRVIYVTDLWEFFAEEQTDGTAAETAMEIPTGTPTTSANIDAVIYNGQVLTTHSATVTRAYHGTVADAPGWAATTGVALAASVIHVLKNFEDRCLVTDSSAGVLGSRDLVRIVLPDWSVIAGISLSVIYDIQDIGVHQDRLVLLFARISTSPRTLNNTHVFLWNGVAGDAYDEHTTIKGLYKCHAEREGIIHVFTQVGSTLICSAFNGNSFREVGRIRNIIVSEQSPVPKTRVGVEGDYFVLNASSSGNNTAACPFYWNPYTGDSFFMLNEFNGSFPYRAILITQDTINSPYPHLRYFSAYDTGGSGTGYLVRLAIESTTKGGVPKYKSNWIPAPVFAKDLHKDASMGRMEIERIDIEFNTPPPSSSDIITATLTYKDELTNETYSTYVGTIKNTTANSTNARVDAKRAIIDNIGAVATEFMIDLALTVSTTSWDLIIRRIVVTYKPIALQN